MHLPFTVNLNKGKSAQENNSKQLLTLICFFFILINLYSQDILNKRNPRLVPYNLLDERTKKTNRDSVNNAVRTLIGYGYNIEPPDQESSKSSSC